MKIHRHSFLNLNFFLSFVFLPLLVLLIIFLQYKSLNSQVLGVDTGDTMQLVYHVAKLNQFAFVDAKNNSAIYSTNFREPIPIYFWALPLKLNTEFNKINSFKEFSQSNFVKHAKYSNLFFLALLILSIFFLISEIPLFIANHFEKIIIFILIIGSFSLYGVFNAVSKFNTDLHTSAILCFLILNLVYYYKNPSIINIVVIGVLIGFLCLTKATFFYSGIIVFFITVIFQHFQKINIKSSLLILIVSSVVTMPWLIRNYVQTGQTAISGRGPETFVDRTYEEIYNDKHFIGLWYAYSPDFLKALATKLTGYGFEDRLKGGRLQHSTRAHVIDHEARKLKDENMAINSHFKAGIWMTQVYDQIYAKVKNPVITKKEATKVYKQFALNEMFTHPFRHLKHTIIFAWRGIWILNAIDGRTKYEMGLAKQEPILKQVLPFLGFVSLLGLFIYGLKKQHHLLLLLTIFPISAYAFNSFFSHNLPRYGEAFLPVWLIAFAFVVLVAKAKIQYFFINSKQNP